MVFPGSILNVGGGPLVLSLIRWHEAQPIPSTCGLPDITCSVIFSAYCGNTVVDGTWQERQRLRSSAVGLVCSQTPITVRKTGDSNEVPCSNAASTRPKVFRSGVCSRAPFHSS